MTTIRTDLSALTREGLLQTYASLVEGSDGSALQVGSHIIVLDMMGGDDAYRARVVAVEGNDLLLDVDWDVEHASLAEPSNLAAPSFALHQFGHVVVSGNSLHLDRPGVLIAV